MLITLINKINFFFILGKKKYFSFYSYNYEVVDLSKLLTY